MPVDTPERREALARRLRERVRTISDAAVREQYAREWFARLAGLGPSARGREERRDRRQAHAGALSDPARLRAEVAEFEREMALRLLLPVLRDPSLLHHHEESFAAIELEHPEGERLRREILAWYAESHSLDPAELRNHLSAHGFDGLIEGMLADARGLGPDDGTPESWTSVLERLERIAAKRREAREIAEMLRNRNTDAVSPRLASLGRLLGVGDTGGDPSIGS
jgi:DNA primase